MNDLAVSAMWLDASSDVEAEDHRRSVVAAKVALAGSWPYLAAAASEEEFEARLALMRETVERETPSEALGDVLASLREDFAQMSALRAAEAASVRTSALRVTASVTPTDYLHMHHHGEGAERYYQLDHVALPDAVSTLARHASREDVYIYAQQLSTQARLPVFEDGTHVSGEIVPRLGAHQEFFDRASGRWVRVAVRESDDAEEDDRARLSRAIGTLLAHTAKGTAKRGTCSCGKTNLGSGAKVCPQCGDHVPGYKQALFTPDPTDAQRYDSYPPITDFPSQGGSPLAPVSQVGPDGFPVDEGVGEQRTPEAYARQTTPGQWAVPPDAAWPADQVPNAATGLPNGQVVGPGWPRSAAAGDIIPTPHVRVDARPDKGRYDVNYVESPMSMQTILRTHNEEQAREQAKAFAAEHGILHHTGSAEDPNDMTRGGHRPFPYHYTPSETQAYDIGKEHFHAGEPYSAYKVPDIINQNPEHLMYTRGWMGAPKEHTAPTREMERRWVPSSQDADGNRVPGRHEPITSARHHADRQSERATAYHEWATEAGHDPDDLATLKLYEKQPGVSREHADEIADIYHGEPDTWRSDHRMRQHTGTRRTAQEGIAGTPGPNPNYFSNDSYGLASPPGSGFPTDPGPEPHPDDSINPMIEYYGGVPPEHSTGTATTGTEDGGGYTRQAAAIPKGRQLCSNCDGQGTVGTTSNEGEHDCPQCGGKGHVKMGSRQYLGTLVHEGEYQYVHKQGDQWVITQKGTGKVLSHHDTEDDAKASFRAMMMNKTQGSRHTASEMCLAKSGDHECGLDKGHSGPHQCTLGGQCNEPGSTWGSGTVPLHSRRSTRQQPDFPQSARERTAASEDYWDEVGRRGRNDPQASKEHRFTPDEKGVYCTTCGGSKGSVLHKSASGPYQNRGEQGEHYGDPNFAPPTGPEGEDSDCNCHTDRDERQVVVNPMCPVHGHYAKESRRAQGGQHTNDYYDGHEHGLAGYPLTHFDSMPPRGYIEGHEQGQHERGGMSQEERDEHDAYYHRWNQQAPASARQASTNGQIVGACDHCRTPLRWHDADDGDPDGHLEHLHNRSHKCSPGASSTTTARTAGLTRLPQFFDLAHIAAIARTATGDNSGFATHTPSTPGTPSTPSTGAGGGFGGASMAPQPSAIPNSATDVPNANADPSDGQSATNMDVSAAIRRRATMRAARTPRRHHAAATASATASQELAIEPATDSGPPPVGPGMDPRMNQDTVSKDGDSSAQITDSNVPQAGGNDPAHIAARFTPIPPLPSSHYAAQTLTAPTAENPTGRDPDEYRSNTWEGLVHQRPMQSAEERGVNTPVKPSEAEIPGGFSSNTPTPGLGDSSGSTRNDDDLEEEDDER